MNFETCHQAWTGDYKITSYGSQARLELLALCTAQLRTTEDKLFGFRAHYERVIECIANSNAGTATFEAAIAILELDYQDRVLIPSDAKFLESIKEHYIKLDEYRATKNYKAVSRLLLESRNNRFLNYQNFENRYFYVTMLTRTINNASFFH
jgi:hypothetical protein